MIHAELTRTDDELVHQMSKGLMSPISNRCSTQNDHRDVNMGPYTWRSPETNYIFTCDLLHIDFPLRRKLTLCVTAWEIEQYVT
jgi:hypothetical protein